MTTIQCSNLIGCKPTSFINSGLGPHRTEKIGFWLPKLPLVVKGNHTETKGKFFLIFFQTNSQKTFLPALKSQKLFFSTAPHRLTPNPA